MQQTSSSPDADVLDRYLAGEATVEEHRIVEQWLAANPGRRRALSAVRAGITDALGPVPGYDANARASAVVQAVLGAAQQDLTVRETRPARRSHPHEMPAITNSWLSSKAWRAAAGLAIAAVLVGVGLFTTSYRQRQTTSQSLVTYVTTANGERTTIKLADGSTVTLNVASRIEIPKDFGSHIRTIELTGEAFFDVASTSSTPFVVKTGAVRTTVLGTEFSVRAYNAAEVQVAVRSGKVSVENVVLSANDIAHVVDDTSVVVKRRQSIETAMAFVNGRLVLSDIPLQMAIDDLERWYDVRIQFADPALAKLPISAVLPSGSISNLIDVLRMTFDIRVVREGRLLTLYSR